MSQREWSQDRERERRNAGQAPPRRAAAAPVPGRGEPTRYLTATNIARREHFDGDLARPGLDTEFERGDGWTDDHGAQLAHAQPRTRTPEGVVGLPVVRAPATPTRRLPPGMRMLEATNIARRDHFDADVALTQQQPVDGFEVAD